MPARRARTVTPPDRRWLILTVLSISLLVVSLDNTILNVALPVIAETLHASSSQLQWIVDAYATVFAGLLLVAGSLGDRLGRKGVFMVGLAAFGCGSTWAAFSGSVGGLIAARAFMGVGAAAIMPCSLSILTNVFTDGPDRSRAIGIWSGVTGVGVAVGPVIGGWLLARFWWGSVFLVNVPVTVVGIVLVSWLVPSSRDPQSRRPDPVGAALSTAGLALLLWGIIEAPSRTWTSSPVLAALIGSAALLGMFVWWERRSSHPMLDLSVFSSPRFSVAMGAMAMVTFALMSGLFVLTQYLQFSLGYTPLQAGLRVSPVAATLLVVAPLSSVLVRAFGSKPVVFTGMGLVATGLWTLSHVTVHGTYTDALPGLLLIGLGTGLALPSSVDSVMGSLPPETSGVGAGTNGAALQVGGGLGVGVIGSIMNSRYQARILPTLAHYPVPVPVRDAITGSLGGALAVAERVGGLPGRTLSAAARVAFVDGMGLAVGVSAAVVGVAAVTALVLLPNRAGPPAIRPPRPAPAKPQPPPASSRGSELAGRSVGIEDTEAGDGVDRAEGTEERPMFERGNTGTFDPVSGDG